jgi:threonine dehydratase
MLPPKQIIPATSQRAEPQTRLDLNRIRSAIPRIPPVFRNTPQYACSALGEALDCELIVKLETVVEPSAALGIAAILEHRARYRDKRVVTIICGSNVTPTDFERWVIKQDDE